MSTHWVVLFAVTFAISGGCTPRKMPPKDPQSVTKQMLQRFKSAEACFNSAEMHRPSITVNESADFGFPPNQLWSTIPMDKRQQKFRSIVQTLCPCSLSQEAKPQKSPSCRILWQGGMDPTCIEVFLSDEAKGRFRLTERYNYGEMYEFENASKFQELIHDLLVSAPESLSYPINSNENPADKATK